MPANVGDAPIVELPDRALVATVNPYAGPVPVLFGHCWWRQGTAEPVKPMATCLDFSVAAGGDLAAYGFDGEPHLYPANRVWA